MTLIPEPEFADDDREDIYTREGWEAWATRPPDTKPTLDAPNSVRKAWVSDLPPIATPELLRAHRQIMQLVNKNRRVVGPRPHMAIDGPAGVGKSIIATTFGRHYVRSAQQLLAEGKVAMPRVSPMWTGYAAFVPVALIGLGSRSNTKDLNKAILRFYDAPIDPRASKEDLTPVCQAVVRGCATRVVIVDDVDWLFGQTPRVRDEAMLHLKDLGSRLGATFLFTGIGLQQRGFFEDPQFGRRCKRHELDRYTLRSRGDAERWRSLLASFESQLPLRKLGRRTLVAMWPYLYERTSGFLCSLNDLLGEASEFAIDSGVETLNEALLEEIPVDNNAQERRPAARVELRQWRARTRTKKP